MKCDYDCMNNCCDIRLRLIKRIEELKILLLNSYLTKDESMELQYWLRENTMALGDNYD